LVAAQAGRKFLTDGAGFRPKKIGGKKFFRGRGRRLTCSPILLRFGNRDGGRKAAGPRAFIDNLAVDLFRFRPARDRVTGTGGMSSEPSCSKAPSGRKKKTGHSLSVISRPATSFEAWQSGIGKSTALRRDSSRLRVDTPGGNAGLTSQ
jgi:hypothetical protein